MIHSPLLARFVPALPQACAVIGGPQIRNRGTLGGNLANASPAADTLAAALRGGRRGGARLRLGRRELPIADFFTGAARPCSRRTS